MRNIEIKGARVHNLKNIDVTIPRNSLTVITGMSGSGKSSLAFDTLYSESQRRYVESLSSYARQFLGLMEKPDVDRIDGLSPAISIEQKTTGHNPRSTVGTITEIHDYLRLLYARVGTPTCYKCGRVIERQTVQEIADSILALGDGVKFQILAPVVRNRKGVYKDLLEKLQKNGYVRVRVDGVVYGIDDDIPMDKNKKHNIEVVIDRLVNSQSIAGRLTESIETALSVGGDGMVVVEVFGMRNADRVYRGEAKRSQCEMRNKSQPQKENDSTDILFSERLACPVCGISCEALTPAMFSFNSPMGACEECHGLGYLLEVDPDLVAPDQDKTISEGAIIPWNGAYIDGGWNNHMLHAVCKHYKIPMNVPYKSLDKKHKDILLNGSGGEKIEVIFEGKEGKSHARFNREFEGVINNLLRRHKDTSSDDVRRWIETFMAQKPCVVCGGARYKKDVLAVKIFKGGSLPLAPKQLSDKKTSDNYFSAAPSAGLCPATPRHVIAPPAPASRGSAPRGTATSTVRDSAPYPVGYNIAEISDMSIESAFRFFEEYAPEGNAKEIAKPIIREVLQRLGFLNDVGLSYLTLNRTAATLSGGESQRIRLATQIGSRLTGVLYILDEPSIGLHPRDNTRLLATLTALRDLDNTVVVIEHDMETMTAADHLIDIGPGAGVHGGRLVACGTPADVAENPKSLTGNYLSGKRKIAVPKKRRSGNGASIKISGAAGHNLKNVDAEFPLGMLVCVTGVSGSGKSSLVNQTLFPALQKKLYNSKTAPLPYKSICGLSNLDKVIDIDQSPIGRTPRSNPATYTKTFDQIRNLFAMLPESKIRGYTPGRFSFNVKGGRCETCEGDGVLKIEMHFLPDVYVECETCGGKRYNRDTLEVLYKGKSISDVLEMTVDEGLVFFDNLSAIKQKLQVLSQVGLGYIRLGQPATTLSGGEAQRIKLASELAKRATGKTLYILDEPTTGLHFEDIQMLMSVIQELVDKGNSVIVIEHNLDVIKCADYIVDLGPEGGDKGGTIVTAGTPEAVARDKRSVTGEYLREYLKL